MTTELWLWVCGGALGVINSLLGAICFLLWRHAQAIVKENERLTTQLELVRTELRNDLRMIEGHIETERTERIEKHDALAIRVFEKIEKTDQAMGDVRETVAGFGTVYLPRREYEVREQKQRGA